MSAERLWIAAALAIAAAFRLVLWRWHVKSDKAWLAKRFGKSGDDEWIAQAHSMTVAAVLAGAAAAVLYA